jgi:hypothetical protein
MRVMAQMGMVMKLDKCIGCHTCSVTCKQAWTNRAGTEYIWFNNVETRPGQGYPRRYEDQERWRGGRELNKRGRLKLKGGGRLKKLFGWRSAAWRLLRRCPETSYVVQSDEKSRGGHHRVRDDIGKRRPVTSLGVIRIRCSLRPGAQGSRSRSSTSRFRSLSVTGLGRPLTMTLHTSVE